MNIGVILAGGTGARFGSDIPKQFLSLKGKEIICYSIEAFLKNKHIDEVYVVSHADWTDHVEELLAGIKPLKPVKILVGGERRCDSSLAAIKVCPADANLLFHDAARPLVAQNIISEAALKLIDFEAVDTAVKTTDTILKVSCEGFIESIPDRDSLYNSQTPQGFRLKVISDAYEKAMKDPDFKATDDCGIVRKYLPDVKIKIIMGDIFNSKLTHREDLPILELFLKKQAEKV